jgi:hypothetical protein
MRMVLPLVFATLAACSKGASNQCSVGSVGSCDPGAERCGVVLSCRDDSVLELRCVAPEAKDCTCVANGVVGKTARLADGLPKLDNLVKAAAVACDWSIVD